jgi:hypothetical protein
MTCISNTNIISPWLVFHVTSKIGLWPFCHFTELNLNVRVHIQRDIQNWFALPKCSWYFAYLYWQPSYAITVFHSLWIPVHLLYMVSCVCMGICVHTWLPAPLSSCAVSPLYCRKLLCTTLLNSLIPYLFCYWHNLCRVSILHRRPENRYASIMYVLLF